MRICQFQLILNINQPNYEIWRTQFLLKIENLANKTDLIYFLIAD